MGRHLATEICRDEDDALVGAVVQDHLVKCVLPQKLTDRPGRIAAAMAVEILLEDSNDLGFFQARAVGCVFQRLPDHITAGIIELVLDDHQLPVPVERQQVEPLPGAIEAIEFLLNDQQAILALAHRFAERVRHRGKPFLKVFSLPESDLGKAGAFKLAQAVGGTINLEHLITIKISKVKIRHAIQFPRGQDVG